ncbi:hypothetical protein LOK74_09620 [Brevibacillus humidisoli]|uniref:hypothetical protein n=1 Tax=Brevibacillus humidisoli TaxID=2895522 RepID=UPI001E5A3A47|nr:hypothetical protein [Brevibacillus humidisoli]UFJ42725.1 hypothetical protein LOK74_09620 [Brevibacillus humidisoli]
MEWKEWVNQTFAKQCNQLSAETTASEQKLQSSISKVPFHRKALAVTGVISLTAALAGCAEDEPELTTYDECQWEVETNGLEYDCDDEDSSFYVKKGYKNKSQKVSASSSFYKSQVSRSVSSKGGIGSGGSRSFGG